MVNGRAAQFADNGATRLLVQRQQDMPGIAASVSSATVRSHGQVLPDIEARRVETETSATRRGRSRPRAITPGIRDQRAMVSRSALNSATLAEGAASPTAGRVVSTSSLAAVAVNRAKIPDTARR